ncbi:hypothetical protein C1646_749247 [Rhizophagus diaphanus]|nr:hypothetical protein C1646_749247 [Rhizophagus diaphanus] [Rhizophagus sp. MUCL 43196]
MRYYCNRYLTRTFYKQVLVKKLQSRGIELNGKENKEELVINLEKELNKKVERKKLEQEKTVGVLVNVTNSQTIQCDIKEVYPLQTGWALKENQKFGKKGVEKRMTNQVKVLLEGYFMAGNADKSNRYTAQDMQYELKKEYREEAATRVLNYNNKDIASKSHSLSIIKKHKICKK